MNAETSLSIHDHEPRLIDVTPKRYLSPSPYFFFPFSAFSPLAPFGLTALNNLSLATSFSSSSSSSSALSEDPSGTASSSCKSRHDQLGYREGGVRGCCDVPRRHPRCPALDPCPQSSSSTLRTCRPCETRSGGPPCYTCSRQSPCSCDVIDRHLLPSESRLHGRGDLFQNEFILHVVYPEFHNRVPIIFAQVVFVHVFYRLLESVLRRCTRSAITHKPSAEMLTWPRSTSGSTILFASIGMYCSRISCLLPETRRRMRIWMSVS